MTVQVYNKRPKWHDSALEEFAAILTPLEKKLSQRMQLIKIPAKRGSTAPVLLTHEMVSAIDMLIAHRHMAGVAADNPFLFANANSTTFLGQ